MQNVKYTYKCKNNIEKVLKNIVTAKGANKHITERN